jgi:hypothetical protein
MLATTILLSIAIRLSNVQAMRRPILDRFRECLTPSGRRHGENRLPSHIELCTVETFQARSSSFIDITVRCPQIPADCSSAHLPKHLFWPCQTTIGALVGTIAPSAIVPAGN